MWQNPQLPADLVTFTEETFNGKLHYLVQWFASNIGEVYACWVFPKLALNFLNMKVLAECMKVCREENLPR